MSSLHVVVVGGGVAGVSCAEEVLSVDENATVTLISGSATIKGIANYVRLTDALETFDVKEQHLSELAADNPRMRVVQGALLRVDPDGKTCTLADGTVVPYDKLCLCTGGAPRLIADHPLVLGVRDTQTVEELAGHLRSARRIMIVGNGGIALGLVHELTHLPVVWAIKDPYIGNTFFDASASAFFLAEQRAQGRAFTVLDSDACAGGAAAASGIAAPSGAGVAAVGASAALHSLPPASVHEADAYDWHTDAPLGSMVGEHCSCGAFHHQHDADGAVAGGGTGTAASVADHRDDDEEDREFYPTYGVLPKRQSRRAERRQQGARGKGSAAAIDADDASADAGAAAKRPRLGSAGTAGSGSAAVTSTATSSGAPHPAVRVHGSCLGPTWTQVLRESNRHAAAAASGGAAATGDSAAAALVSAGIAAVSAVTPAAASASMAPVIVERSVTVQALRGCGDSGRVGALADGAWHAVDAAGQLEATAPAAAEAVGAVPTYTLEGDWPLFVRLSNGHEYGVDLLVSATGTVPFTAFLPSARVQREPPGGISVLSPPPSAGVFYTDADGGLLVNQRMQTTGSSDVFAAGDVAAIRWPQELRKRTYEQACAAKQAAARVAAASAAGTAADAVADVVGDDDDDDDAAFPLWFQMRLWNQARTQGLYAGRCAVDRLDPLEEEDGGLGFEMFAHMTRFLGHKVVLLGAFNGQGLGQEYERAVKARELAADSSLASSGATASAAADAAAVTAAAAAPSRPPSHAVEVQLRSSPSSGPGATGEYIKLVLRGGRLMGAMLIGDTDLEETMENLILNRLRLHTTGSGGRPLDLLDPDVDVEDYFD